jgi:hypothetical protein
MKLPRPCDSSKRSEWPTEAAGAADLPMLAAAYDDDALDELARIYAAVVLEHLIAAAEAVTSDATAATDKPVAPAEREASTT